MWIVSLSQALLTPALAALTAYIAWQQWKGNELKLKLDRYDRRRRVYEEVDAMLVRINRDFNPEWGELLQFARSTAEATFLFGPEIQAYIDEIFDRGNKLRVANFEYRAPSPTRPGYDAAQTLKEMHAHEAWFIDQIPIAREKFRRYLDLSRR